MADRSIYQAIADALSSAGDVASSSIGANPMFRTMFGGMPARRVVDEGTAQAVADLALNLSPYIGDAMALQQATDSASRIPQAYKQGGLHDAAWYGSDAILNGIGILPIIPALGLSSRMVKEADNMKDLSKILHNLDPNYQSGENILKKAYEEGKKAFNPADPKNLKRDYWNDPIPDWLQKEYEDDPMLGRAQLEFYEIGSRGHDFPEKVMAKRIGEIPEAGVSYNFRDQQAEAGTSVLGLLDGENLTLQNDGTYQLFNNGKQVTIGGYLHPYKTGSDGEPLLLYPWKIE